MPKSPSLTNVSFRQFKQGGGLVPGAPLEVLKYALSTSKLAAKIRSDILIAREVFAVRLQQGVYAGLIICSECLIDVKRGDEVMGPVPKLLYLGTSSTTSTPWHIPDGIGAKFFGNFFKSITENVRSADGDVQGTENAITGGEKGRVETRWVAMAMAMSNAIAKLAPDQTERLYIWTGLVLHRY